MYKCPECGSKDNFLKNPNKIVRCYDCGFSANPIAFLLKKEVKAPEKEYPRPLDLESLKLKISLVMAKIEIAKIQLDISFQQYGSSEEKDLMSSLMDEVNGFLGDLK